MLTDRPKKKTKVFNKACLTCLLLLVGLGIVLIVVATQASGGSRPSHNFKHLDLEQFGAAASRDLTHCGPSSKASICKWARQYSRANRKRPADWKPKPGWQEDTAHDGQQARHISDRSLTALDNSSQPTSSHTATRPLSEVLKTLWPLHDQTQTAEQHPAALPQCAAFRGQSCVAILGNASIVPTGLQGCLIVGVLDSPDVCSSSVDVWITQQPSGSLLFTAPNNDELQCESGQMLRRPKAVWYLGGQISQVEEVHSSSALKSISAVHFPPDVWRQQYSSSLPAGSEATDKQPSALWIGVVSVLECVPGTTSLHVYVSSNSGDQCEQCDALFELNFMTNLTQASLITLYQCAGGSCGSQAGTMYPVEQGIATAGVRLYPHKTKWQQKGRTYADEEEEDEDA